ncbi:hypothetical protein GCM10027277_06440 [Pseudoduganella ginsengisoli]|uniref:Uncharacterized protein n=1 Tax=Pseudoduganella ginsengisoli TaxID=1462440 RepID=A0A6L6Q760_9BURK|nr:hypothetical protein [Pseudoduganella ginsengisoli]MTW05294.1 hypothetical protein [Pseudoduganella ginsengisoli]
MNSIQTSRFLKNAFIADAAACSAVAALHLARPQAVIGLLNLPEPLLQGTGLFLVLYVLMLAGLAASRTLWRPLVLLVVAGNVLWALASIDILVLGIVQPSVLGEAYVIAQALATLGLAWLQYIGLKKSQPAGAVTATLSSAV